MLSTVRDLQDFFGYDGENLKNANLQQVPAAELCNVILPAQHIGRNSGMWAWRKKSKLLERQKLQYVTPDHIRNSYSLYKKPNKLKNISVF